MKQPSAEVLTRTRRRVSVRLETSLWIQCQNGVLFAVAAIKVEFLAVEVNAQGPIIAHVVAHPGLGVTGQGDVLGYTKEATVVDPSSAS